MNILGQLAQIASRELKKITVATKNDIFDSLIKILDLSRDEILCENKRDLENTTRLRDRLLLTNERIDAFIVSINQMKALDSPVGNVLSMKKMDNGLLIGKKVVPLGVVAIIYESRPNVTLDAFLLCFKTNNVCILKGGKEALYTNIYLSDLIREVLIKNGCNPDYIQLIKDTSRESTKKLMKLDRYVDCLIPRGGASLIQAVLREATIPVIETGVGNCHIYVDEFADMDKALRITVNAKTDRVTVCNAAETIVVHKLVAKPFLKALYVAFKGKVEIFGCERTRLIIDVSEATEEDYLKEYLDYKVAIIIVDSYNDAVDHITKYSTKHSEAIITENYSRANAFLEDIDSACVYVNASTRFSDGFEFGMGAEIGISTQKLHARGPMGLDALTTYKYIIYGEDHIRE